jgi:hypothetical protein
VAGLVNTAVTLMIWLYPSDDPRNLTAGCRIPWPHGHGLDSYYVDITLKTSSVPCAQHESSGLLLYQ